MNFNAIKSPGNVDTDLLSFTIPSVKESLTKSGPLEDNSSDKEVNRHGRVSVPFEESHQEAKTDKHHHMNILKHFLLKKKKINKITAKYIYEQKSNQ